MKKSAAAVGDWGGNLFYVYISVTHRRVQAPDPSYSREMTKKKHINAGAGYIPIMLRGLFLILLLTGCQEEYEEVTPPTTDEAILANSTIAGYVQKIARKDGSSDNILDHSSCLTLVLPVAVIVNGQEVQIESADDLGDVEEILDDSLEDDDTLNIIFPATVILADHTQIVIQNQDQLDEVIDDCTEGGSDEDIECLDFLYPLTITVYDSRNQLANTITVNDDEELFNFFENLGDTDYASFQFPVTVTLLDGTAFTINDNTALEEIIEDFMGDCDEDDDTDHNDDDADDTEFIGILIDGTWQVTQYVSGTNDETSVFSDFVFVFNDDGTSLSTDSVTFIPGTWETNGDDGTLELELDSGDDSPFDKITEDWDIVEYSSSLIRLKHIDEESNDGETKLVFEKN